MNKIEVVIENTGKHMEIAQGTSLAELAAKCKNVTGHTVLGALVNNETMPLEYRLYNPKCIRFFDINDRIGWRVYRFSLAFMLYKAVHDCYPEARLKIEHSLLNGFYTRIEFANDEKAPQQIEVARRVRERMIELQEANLPFESKTVLLSDALSIIKEDEMPETYRLLQSLNQLYVTLQFLDGTPHKIASNLVPNTGCLDCWDFRTFEEGYLLQGPDPAHPQKLSLYQETPKLFNIFQEHRKWVKLLHVPTIADLNRIVRDNGANHLIHVSEALHEKKYADIADAIYERRDVKMVLLAGPSSSGKTTSCRRLAVQLSVLGYNVQQMSLDDYFVSREKTPLQPNGEHDFEALEALDIPLLNDHLLRLIKGERVEIPTYDFIKGEPYFSGKSLQMKKDSILIVEGIHALNPRLTAEIPNELKYKVYVSALTQIAIDDQNMVHSSDNRLIRRIVRDNNFRGYNATNTLKRWESVMAGESKHIFPFQENADIMFNSSLLYELGMLRTFAEPLLKQVPENEEVHADAMRLLNFVELIEPIDPKFVPPTSIMREFLGGSSFEY